MIIEAEIFRIGRVGDWHARVYDHRIKEDYCTKADSKDEAKKFLKRKLKKAGYQECQIVFRIFNADHFYPHKAVFIEGTEGIWFLQNKLPNGRWLAFGGWWRTKEERIQCEIEVEDRFMIPANELDYYYKIGYLNNDEIHENPFKGPPQRLLPLFDDI